MNILITGSNGFIGGHVAQYLKNRGHYIVGLGRKEQPTNKDYVNKYISCNIGKDDVYQYVKKLDVKLDAVIHLAADMRKEPYCTEVVGVNCCGTQRLLELCKSENIGVFLQLSSLPVIGHPVEHPITENHPVHPYTVYHITKLTEEMLATYAYEYYSIRTASFRISAPIGIGVNPNTIFPTFVRKALANEDIVLLGNGTRKQNYLYVLDIAKCLELSLKSPKVHGVYNLTSDLLLSNKELAIIILRVLGSKSHIVYQGEDRMDEYIWDASLERITEDAGYRPSADITKIILEYADWLKSNG